MKPDADDRAILNLHRNRHKRKCTGCNGSGFVMKYIRPNLIDLVECLLCKGTGRSNRLTRPRAKP